MSADAQTPPAEPSPSKIKSLLPFVLALALGLGVGGASGAFVVGPAMAKGIIPPATHAARSRTSAEGAEGDSADQSASDEASADESTDGTDGGDAKADGGGEKAQQVYTLDNLVLNPAESGGTRFLLLSITFETRDAALLEAMKTRDAELRDVVLVTLGAKTVEQLADMKQREALKTELTGATRKLFKKKASVRIYFPQFVIQ